MVRLNENSLEMYRNIAQYFTMGAATLYGLLWIVEDLILGKTLNSNSLGNILIGATTLGGVSMGLLYLLHLSTSRK